MIKFHFKKFVIVKKNNWARFIYIDYLILKDKKNKTILKINFKLNYYQFCLVFFFQIIKLSL